MREFDYDQPVPDLDFDPSLPNPFDDRPIGGHLPGAPGSEHALPPIDGDPSPGAAGAPERPSRTAPAQLSTPSNHLERLSADREGQYSIWIDRRYRICFEWKDGDAWSVEIVDYHD